MGVLRLWAMFRVASRQVPAVNLLMLDSLCAQEAVSAGLRGIRSLGLHQIAFRLQRIGQAMLRAQCASLPWIVRHEKHCHYYHAIVVGRGCDAVGARV